MQSSSPSSHSAPLSYCCCWRWPSLRCLEWWALALEWDRIVKARQKKAQGSKKREKEKKSSLINKSLSSNGDLIVCKWMRECLHITNSQLSLKAGSQEEQRLISHGRGSIASVWTHWVKLTNCRPYRPHVNARALASSCRGHLCSKSNRRGWIASNTTQRTNKKILLLHCLLQVPQTCSVISIYGAKNTNMVLCTGSISLHSHTGPPNTMLRLALHLHFSCNLHAYT